MLRNKVGATTVEELRAAENDLLEYRLAELRERPELVARTYELGHLKALHRQLFQDVYEWAGDLRTVGLAKGEGEDTSFMPPFEIERPVAHVAARIAESDRLRRVDSNNLVAEVTYLHDYLNFAHPFREGNGRTQREFFVQLLAETGRRMAWERVGTGQLHGACHVARTVGDTGPLSEVIRIGLSDE
ncbi:Fic/DOC family protein [Nocardioides cheoyonin]|uniref:Fic/DOC family protein n=1 Tax=Nocardioides cheoyonin TaxID=3156615 RepID=UPI0032B3F325